MAIVSDDDNGPCFMCDEPADAFWTTGGPSHLFICRTCAADKLPLLIADALVGPKRNLSMTEAEAAIERIKGNYWRGVALANLPRKP